jgi:transposase
MGIPPYTPEVTHPEKGIPMTCILPYYPPTVKERLLKQLRCCRNAKLYQRILIIINLLHGWKAYDTADRLGVHNTTVYRVAKRFREQGEAGLFDAREDNGEIKLDERFLVLLDKIVRSTAEKHGWPRPTWTRELLVETLARETGIRIHPATMSRALALIKARRGRPRPTVGCPWSETAKNRKLLAIRQLLGRLPRRHAAFYEDEVDVHLNPKIGLDWMGHGQQKEVMTPGKNVKRYLAGALNVRTGLLLWVEGERKNSYLFIALLHELRQSCPNATVIHLVLDNYRIHDSQIVQAVLKGYFGGRIKLTFLPPYCPQHNKIERVWQDLHANVTRNHTCKTMDRLMQKVREYLQRRNLSLYSRAKAA